MAEKGFIYIAVNNSMPGLIKIGRSSRIPKKRMDELSNTSVPTPFCCVYSALVEDSVYSEKKLHSIFNDDRVNNNREFFSISPETAISKIQSSLDILFEEFNNEAGEAKELHEKSQIITKENQEKEKKKAQEERQAKIEDGKSSYLEVIQFLNQNQKFFNEAIEWAENAYNKPAWYSQVDMWLGNLGEERTWPAFKNSNCTWLTTTDEIIEVAEFPKWAWSPELRYPPYRGIMKWHNNINHLYLGEYRNRVRGGSGIYIWDINDFFIGHDLNGIKQGLRVKGKKEYISVTDGDQNINQDIKIFNKKEIHDFDKMIALLIKR
jgi:hypothetical protein